MRCESMGDIHLGLLTVKVIVGFFALFGIVKLTGRSSINQLTPFHFIFVLGLGDLFGSTIYDDKVKLFHFLYALFLWASLMLIIEFITLKKESARFLVVGNPAIIIRDGVLDRKLIKKNKLGVNQVLSILRQANVFSIREIKYGILEPNGQISTLLVSQYQQPNKADLSLPENPVYLPTSLIIDGEVLWGNLHACGFDEEWLSNQLSSQGYTHEKDIFFAEWWEGKGVHISPNKRS